MYYQDNGQGSCKNPKQECRSIDTTQQFTKILANIPVSTQELRNRVLKKLDFITSFLLSFFFLIQNSWPAYLTSKTSYWATSQTKWYHCLRSTHLSANWQEQQLSLAEVLWSS